MSGPEASDVAIEEIALDGLAEAGGAAGGIDFPAGIEDQRAAHGDVGLGRGAALLQGDDVVIVCVIGIDDVLLDALRFLVYRAKMLHDAAFLSAK